MVKFIGEYSGKVDDKGRIIFPSAFKSLMQNEGDMRFVIKKDIFEDCLGMYTYSEWERQSEELKAKLNFFNRKHAAFWREYMRNRAIVEPDSKLGRITVPKKLLEAIDVMLELSGAVPSDFWAEAKGVVLLRFSVAGKRISLFAVLHAGDLIGPDARSPPVVSRVERVVVLLTGDSPPPALPIPNTVFYALRQKDGSHRFFAREGN